MKFETWICGTVFTLFAAAATFAGEASKQVPSETAAQPQARECNSCTLRHQALLKKKKQREKKAIEDAAAATQKKSGQ